MKLPNPLKDLVLCSRITCSNISEAENASWDDDNDIPYCSKECLVVEQEDQLMRRLDFEDGIYEGYVSPDDAMMNYFDHMEAYDYGR